MQLLYLILLVDDGCNIRTVTLLQMLHNAILVLLRQRHSCRISRLSRRIVRWCCYFPSPLGSRFHILLLRIRVT